MFQTALIVLSVLGGEPTEIQARVGSPVLLTLGDATLDQLNNGLILAWPRGTAAIRVLEDTQDSTPFVAATPSVEGNLEVTVALPAGERISVLRWLIKTGLGPQPPPVPDDPPTPPKPDPKPKPDPPKPGPVDAEQLICVRPWACTVDEADHILTIRETLDAQASEVPYFVALPGVLDERGEVHAGIARYRAAVPDKAKPWVFHVEKRGNAVSIANQGPPDSAAVLGWVGVRQPAQLAFDVRANEEQWLDVKFDETTEGEGLCGALPPTDATAEFDQKLPTGGTLEGFRPIPRREWREWAERFPVERLARNIRHVSKQVMGSCVGHSAMNSTEGAEYTLAGDLFFRRLSAMSMYNRIGTRPNSGAYVGTAAGEMRKRGILPADGETDILGQPYQHTHHVSGDFYDKLPGDWEETAKGWKATVLHVDDDEDAFRLTMDCGLRRHYGRNRHAISGGGVTARHNWWYENSWGVGWGDLGKSIGYDSRFYASYVYLPVLRDECAVLVANEVE